MSNKLSRKISCSNEQVSEQQLMIEIETVALKEYIMVKFRSEEEQFDFARTTHTGVETCKARTCISMI